MLRYDESGHSIEFDGGDKGHPGSPLNKSFNSAVSGASSIHTTASSSKSVLAALRALQDKIRRLEIEKTQALDDAAHLRSQLKAQEIEAGHAKERDALHSQKNLQEARLQYEKVLGEKTEMETKIQQLERKNEHLQDEVHELSAEISQLESSKKGNDDKLSELEDQISQLEVKLQQAHQKEKDLSTAMLWESKRHEEEMHKLKVKMDSLSHEMSDSSILRVEKEAKLVELDHLVGQLLSVNESLVSQLSNQMTTRGKKTTKSASASTTTATKKKKKTTSRTRNVVPRAATLGTASTDAKAAAAEELRRSRSIELRRNASVASENAQTAERLQSMHDMYVSIASSITGKNMGKVKNASRPSSAGKKTTRIKGRKLEGRSVSSLGGDVEHPSSLDLDLFEKKYNLSSADMQQTQSDVTPSPTDSHGKGANELQSVIDALEEEFQALNAQYQQILSSSPTGNTEERSRELVSVIQRLHKKASSLGR